MNPILTGGAAAYLRWRSTHWDRERLERHQRRRIDRLIDVVRSQSAYYRERLPSGPLRLGDLPTMTKAEMMAHFDEINTGGLHRDDLVAFRIDQERMGLTDLYPGGIAVGLSSGTSGNKVLTVLSPRERERYAALLLARSGLPPHLPERRVLFALRTNNPAFTAVRSVGVELVYVDYFVPVPDMVRTINRLRLNVLAGPPSLLSLLAGEHGEITSRIDAVISYAEELDEPVRARIEEAFGVRVVEIYQGAEGMLGFTCPAGSLHLNEDVALVELVESGDTLGAARRAIVTDLYRRLQPFVRYELNDLLEVDESDCACGSVFRVIRRIHGRSDSIFLLPREGGGLVRLMPDYVRRSINQASDTILEYQAVQLSPDLIEIRLSLEAGADRRPIEETIRANLAHWATRAGGRLGTVVFSATPPTRDPVSHKLVRVMSRCP